jgi:phosphomannomutase
MLGKEMDDMFIKEILSLTLNDDIDKDINIVYTPLYGTGLVPVTRILKERGFHNIVIVEEQKNPDGTFPTTPYPNPENVKVFEIPKKYGKENKCGYDNSY